MKPEAFRSHSGAMRAVQGAGAPAGSPTGASVGLSTVTHSVLSTPRPDSSTAFRCAAMGLRSHQGKILSIVSKGLKAPVQGNVLLTANSPISCTPGGCDVSSSLLTVDLHPPLNVDKRAGTLGTFLDRHGRARARSHNPACLPNYNRDHPQQTTSGCHILRYHNSVASRQLLD